MDWEVIAPMVVLTTGILTAGGVLIFRPIAKRLGDLLELRVKQGRGEIEDPRTERMERLLESVSARMSLIEERQDFADSLLRQRGEAKELPHPQPKETWES